MTNKSGDLQRYKVLAQPLPEAAAPYCLAALPKNLAAEPHHDLLRFNVGQRCHDVTAVHARVDQVLDGVAEGLERAALVHCGLAAQRLARRTKALLGHRGRNVVDQNVSDCGWIGTGKRSAGHMGTPRLIPISAPLAET